jgi:hypothetical protein
MLLNAAINRELTRNEHPAVPLTAQQQAQHEHEITRTQHQSSQIVIHGERAKARDNRRRSGIRARRRYRILRALRLEGGDRDRHHIEVRSAYRPLVEALAKSSFPFRRSPVRSRQLPANQQVFL